MVATFVNKYVDYVSDDLFSQVLAFRSCAAESIRMAQANNKNVKELLNFTIQLDLISSFNDSVVSPGNEVMRGGTIWISSPPLPGIVFSSETVLICLREF